MRSPTVCRLVHYVSIVAGAFALSCSVEADGPTPDGPATTVGGGGSGTAGAAPVTTAGTTSSTSGASSGGTSSVIGGQSAGGNAATGGAGTAGGGSSSGGSGGSGGSTSSAGSGGTSPAGDAGTPGNYPLKNPPVKSAGCGTQGMQTLLSGGTTVAQGLATSKRLKITSGGQEREYIIDIPADYDSSKPYRLFYTSHWIGSTDTAVATGSVSNGGAQKWGFYGLHRVAMAAGEPAIFVAPQSDGQTWQQKDHALFDDILAKVSAALCIDTSRVFATGFSFGGMITYSLSTNHQKQIRAAVGTAPANYNIYLPNPIPKDPIAWMSTTGMGDGTCPWDGGNNRGAKYIATSRAADNGCTAATIPTWTSASPTRHVCYDYQGCKSNYPVKACTFNGNHQAAPTDSGGGDNGETSWIPTESWKFFTQF